MPRALSVGATLYRAAVHLYPPAFRREFAHEMTRDYLQAADEAWLDGGWRSMLTLWGHLSVDLVQAVVLQWLRSGRPAIALIPAIFTLMGIGLTAQLVPETPVALPVSQTDRDLLVLMLLVIVVLMIVVATIVFTLCFTRPLLYRRRL